MCLAKATLVYGLTIRSASLVSAADAWERLSSTLSFFDLVFLRRRKGGLVSKGGGGYSAVTKVPNEVWEEMRHWLVQEEVADSEGKLLEDLRCDDPNCDTCVPLGVCTRWEDFLSRKKDCTVIEGYFDELGAEFISGWAPSLIPGLKRLVDDFGLDVPVLEPILTQSRIWTDEKALALIAAPSELRRGTSDSSLVDAACGRDREPDEQTLVDVSFRLPRNINQRFTRFIRLFDFEAVSSSINRISSSGINPSKNTRKRSKTSRVQNHAITKEIKPSWKLYLTCETPLT